MEKARFYAPEDGGVCCLLCPHHCFIKEGGRGKCGSRECREGHLFALSYGKPCSIAIDPVEKKPLNRFLPGTFCLSLSCTGCNLSCRWCQNSSISQVKAGEVEEMRLSPEEVVKICLGRGLPSIAYTYTEPLTWWEYMYDIAVLAHEHGLKNILVSAAYVEKEPLLSLLPYIDAANIDIKAMDESIYRKWCGSSLAPVLDNIIAMKDAGVHLELTNLLVTGVNDSPEMISRLCEWLSENGFLATPLHFSRFFPRYRMKDSSPTPVETLAMAKEIALSYGIKDVFLGNV